MTTTTEHLLRAGTVDEVKGRGCTVVTGGGHAIAVYPLGDGFAAVDNRCPHMGFPLDRGTVSDGILTCHWHHARFDLSSGGTFDPFADDVRAFPVTVTDGQVWVDPSPPEADPVERWSRRLEDGMEHNIRLVIAKSVLGLDSSAADYRTPLTIAATFGTTYSASGWGQAMTMLTCSANMLMRLHSEDRPLALYQGIRQVAAECAGRPPRFLVDPLPTGETRPEVFTGWFRAFIEVRDDEGAERCLRTAIDLGVSPREDSRHGLRRGNRPHLSRRGPRRRLLQQGVRDARPRRLGACGQGAHQPRTRHSRGAAQRGAQLLAQPHRPLLDGLGRPQRAPGVMAAGSRLAGSVGRRAGPGRYDTRRDPAATLEALRHAVRAGALAEQLGGVVAYAAFLRMARFHTSNEFGDWNTVHNTLTAANALHQALKRAPSVELLRAVFDTAISIYLDRFLNMPAQRMPEPDGAQREDDVGRNILEAMDSQQQVEQAARLVTDYFTTAADPDGLLPVLAHAMLREGLHLPPLPDRRRGAEAVRGAQGDRRGAPRACRSGPVPGGPLPDAESIEPDLRHRGPPEPGGRDIQRRIGLGFFPLSDGVVAQALRFGRAGYPDIDFGGRGILEWFLTDLINKDYERPLLGIDDGAVVHPE